ncbi:MAG: hypothetical protein GYA24_25735, partial [Candidatus Lokiarchaeota archaeon]|nr:hypothetical protein [Candidatus Lokiarchaeota archaeon]
MKQKGIIIGLIINSIIGLASLIMDAVITGLIIIIIIDIVFASILVLGFLIGRWRDERNGKSRNNRRRRKKGTGYWMDGWRISRSMTRAIGNSQSTAGG